MPRVVSVRVLRLWVAFTLNDYGETGPPRLGLTRRQAEMRAAFAEPDPPPRPGVPTLDLMEEGQPLGTEPLFDVVGPLRRRFSRWTDARR